MAVLTKEKKSLMTEPPINDAVMSCLYFADDLRFIRKVLRLSQTDLAHKIGYKPYVIWDWENQRSVPKEPSIYLMVIRWAEELRQQLAQS